jgi:glycine/D-amino acid oxidase-like deaminating enzyme
MSEHVRAAVVGGGIVGCSVLDALARRGWTDIMLLERRELTSGSTWHAAGNTTFFGHYASITRLYVDSVAAYLRAEEETGQSVDFHAAGSLRLATNARELAFYRSLEPLFEEMGVPYAVIGPEAMQEAHPLLNVDGLLGAAHTPSDGHVDSSGATRALAQAARQRGAVVRRQSPVETITRDGNRWRLITQGGEVTADNVVLACSFWARELARPLGLNLPIYPLQHHELITDNVPELEALGFEVPTVRDPWAPSNTRQEGYGFLCGVYESDPRFWATDGIPPDFGEELLPPDTERLEPHLLKVIERMPAFGRAGIKTVNNGPICYAPDGCPLLGPVASHPGLWLATAFPVGIGTGGGSGAFLADWVVDGRAPYDLPIVHPSRFPNDLTRETCLARIAETYRRGYTMPETA